jgi:hypothetical protein
MKRALAILLGGLALSLLLGAGTYYWRTAPTRAICCSADPELAWLQHEFQLNDAQYARVQKLYDAYLSDCAATCQRIAATNTLIRAEIATHTNVTPELQALLDASASLRMQCQKQMLTHFYEVSREMPPEQGQRFLAWVQDQVFAMPHEGSEMTMSAAHPHDH